MEPPESGEPVIEQQDKHQLRRYLLGQLTEAEEEAVEVRLLTDADYSEESDIVANELTDRYVNGDVSAEERERLERFFFASPERRDKLRFALALKRRASELEARQRRLKKALRLYLPVAAAVLIVAGLGVWLTFVRDSDVDRGLAALRKAYGGVRPVEARVTDSDYAPAAELRGPEKADTLQSDLAASLLLSAVAQHPDADSHRALGQYYIATHQFDKAVEQLKAALSFDPRDAKAHSDLGVALLERGKRRGPDEVGAMQDFGESLQHFDAALKLDGSLLEALFNRALLRQYMLLPEQAADDWRAYLGKDPNSGWADEARRNLKKLEEGQQNKSTQDDGRALRDFYAAYERGDDEKCKELISRSYNSAGNTITNALIASYLEADSESEGGVALRALDYIGNLESERAGDSYTTDLIRFYRGATPAQRQALATARLLMKRGYERYLRSELNDALSDLGQAKSVFAEVGDAQEALFAEYLMNLCYFFQLDLAKTESFFQRLLALSEEKRYVWLQAQSLHRLGMLRQNDSKLSEAIEYSLRALEKFERAHDANGIIKVLTNLADEYESLNDQRQSLLFLRRGLSVAEAGNTQLSEVWGLYTAVGLNLNALNLTAAALAYQEEALRIALKMARPLYVSRSRAYLGMTYANLQLYDEALAHIGAALSAGSGLAGETSGREMMANALLYAGEIHRRRGEHDKAVEAFDRAINFYDGLNFPHFRYTAHKGKLLALLARHNDPSGEAELRTVLGIFEQYRLDLTSEGQRNTFFDVEQSVYDRVIDFVYVKKKDAGLAFDYSELSRSRSLLDAMRQGVEVSAGAAGPELRLLPGSAPLPLSDIQRRMPEGAQVLQYAVLDDKILAWAVTASDVSTEKIEIDSHALEGKVRAYLQSLGGPPAGHPGASEQAAKDLYDILVRPFESRLDKTKLLCVVPDKILHYVPFAALVSGTTGRYLVEDYRITRAPSSTIFIECSERARRKAGVAEEKLLSIGDPAFDRKAFGTLSPLPSAGAEARGVAAFYRPAQQLLGGNATEKAVRSEIGKYEVVNFALHYVVNEQSSMLSGMALAGERAPGAEGDDDGFWQVFEIYKTELPRTRLVVLSACQTAVEQQYKGEGAAGVARPFISAGVPVVVATLWPVNSDSTAQLIIALHKYRRLERAPTADALRRAQLALLKGDDERYRHPHHWAAFTAIGGYTEF